MSDCYRSLKLWTEGPQFKSMGNSFYYEGKDATRLNLAVKEANAEKYFYAMG